MATTRPTTYRECGLQLSALVSRFAEIRTRMGYSEEDARGHALEQCRAVGNSALMIVMILGAAEENRVDLLKLVGFQSGDPQLTRVFLDESARIYLLMMFQFKLETLWKNLLRELGKSNLRQGYHNMVRDLFGKVPVADLDGSKIDSLLVPALIRNSLHSDGYHYGYRGTSHHIELDGVEYKFYERAQVQCAGWYHIIHALNCATTVLEEILDSPAIKSLPDPVHNDFAPSEGT